MTVQETELGVYMDIGLKLHKSSRNPTKYIKDSVLNIKYHKGMKIKKLLGILVLSLFSFNINNVIAAEKATSFSCGTTNGPSEGISLSIDLDKRTMEFGLPKYKITSISDDTVVGWSPGKDNGKNFEKSLTFDRYTEKLTLIHYTEPPFIWNLKCKRNKN